MNIYIYILRRYVLRNRRLALFAKYDYSGSLLSAMCVIINISSLISISFA